MFYRGLGTRLLGGEAEEESARRVLGLKQVARKGMLCFWELQGCGKRAMCSLAWEEAPFCSPAADVACPTGLWVVSQL